MEISLYLSAFMAGAITLLSPCILPIIPFVASSSLKQSKFGPIFLGLGVVLSFSVTTFFLARSGQFIGLDPSQIKYFSGTLLFISSLLFIFPKLTDFISKSFAPVMNKFQNLSTRSNEKENGNAVWGEFVNGLMLGPIWTPCSGPTLAVIMGLLAAQEDSLKALSLLGFFAVGSLIPMIILSYGASKLVSKIKNFSLNHAKKIKLGSGILCLMMSIMLLTNYDKKVEAYLLSVLPESIINFTISI
ncbi:putative cytochrome c biogenesis-related protein [Halobacteriovorax marinus SJ]|uniref:Cytochrome c biogenesis-related protein n=1 Tax=Halobacteriovorax marinus (strain ATCC BAA-682 / DSM 15412 / SJ) TaxID=862908 RepID=E1WX57_HALMS|nr:cytochrome c biogenesis CcdA family protein [Halobacteriovorax marinus]CBW25758.1 putative cytochrome c biogenesis-related protein [Halobacteriovorax marinus SJ]